MSVFHKTVADAADKRRGFSFFRFDGGKLADIHHILGEAGALDSNDAVVCFGRYGDDVEVDGGGKHFAVIVVGVVAADFAASGDGKDGKGICFSIEGDKSIDSVAVPCADGILFPPGVERIQKLF